MDIELPTGLGGAVAAGVSREEPGGALGIVCERCGPVAAFTARPDAQNRPRSPNLAQKNPLKTESTVDGICRSAPFRTMIFILFCTVLEGEWFDSNYFYTRHSGIHTHNALQRVFKTDQ